MTEYAHADIASDAFGHLQMGGAAETLVALLKQSDEEILQNAKYRAIELSLLQRCAAHCAAQTDIDEAYEAGKVAVASALSGFCLLYTSSLP